MKKHLNSYQNRKLAEFKATILDNPYIPHEPTEKQAIFLMLSDYKEGFYGGSAGGGKSEALLMAALQYVEIKGYAALLLRRTYADLALPEALMDRADEWLRGMDAKWIDKTKTWTFPSGATLSFGYLEYEKDKYRYQSAAFQYIGFDEVTQFTESQYNYLFSRLRRLERSDIPLRMRSASNPGNIGHEWVKRKFIIQSKEELENNNRFFIPALLEDNPYLDRGTYEGCLRELDPVTYEQLRHGNWDIALKGELFKREWFEIVENIPKGRQVRFWDLAATEPKEGKDPDWTVGCLLLEDEGIFYIKDILRFRKHPRDVEKIIAQTAQIDGYETQIFMEQEPGASGVDVIDYYARRVLKGYSFRGIRHTGSKLVRAQPLAAAAANRNLKVINAPWLNDLLYELESFPQGLHDDIVDALSGAFNQLNPYVGSTSIPVDKSSAGGPEIPGFRTSRSGFTRGREREKEIPRF